MSGGGNKYCGKNSSNEVATGWGESIYDGVAGGVGGDKYSGKNSANEVAADGEKTDED